MTKGTSTDATPRISGDPFNPFTSDFQSDPYPHYRRIRELDPVHWSFIGVWMVTRHGDVQSILRSPGKFSSRLSVWDRYGSNPKFRNANGEPTPYAQLTEPMMIFRDVPAHTRLRSLVQRAFAPRRIQAMRTWMSQEVERLLDAAEERGGSMDIMADLAWPLPVNAICEMLGVPTSDRDFIRGLSRRVAPAIAPLTRGATMDAANEACAQFEEYFRRLANERRKRPGADLLSAFLMTEEAGDHLTEAEVISNCFLLFSAGHETTVNLIGNGVNALLRNREQFHLLRKCPELMPNAVEEFARYDSPVQIVIRNALETSQVGDKVVKQGEQIFVFIGAANRDENAYPRSDVLDVARKGISHLAFGHGIHFCLGAALGRLEADVAVSALLRRYPKLDVVDIVPRWGNNILLRGLRALLVSL